MTRTIFWTFLAVTAVVGIGAEAISDLSTHVRARIDHQRPRNFGLGSVPMHDPRPRCSGVVLSRAAHHVEREEDDPQD